MKTYPMKVEDGKVYAEVTLRDVVERCDVSDLPILAEVKRLYDENAKLRELVRHLRECTRHNVCAACAYADDACDFDYDMRELGVDESFEATLGRGTCYLISALQYGDDCKECSSCGAVADEYMFESGRCPSCGAKVVDE